MTLKSGASPGVISENITEIMNNYKRTGRISGAIPKDAKDALKQARAIAYANAQITKRRYRKRKKY